MSENRLQSDVHDTPIDKPVGKKPEWRSWMVLSLIAGVILPLLALATELAWRVCSSAFFDPIPTYWHIALLCATPIATLLVLHSYRKGDARFVALTSLLIGASIGVSLVYSLMFLPITPASLIGLMFVGIGLLGFSPFFAFTSALVCNNRFKMLPYVGNRQHTILMRTGFTAAAIVAGAFMISSWATDIGLNMAVSDNQGRSDRGMKILRLAGSDSTLLRACYSLPTSSWFRIGNIWGASSTVTRDEARTIYYRVTGRSFNSVPPPRLIGLREDWAWDTFADSDVGGTAVNSMVTDLSMTSSRIDSVMEPDTLTAYTEWTMVFTNRSRTQNEARAEIALPPGSVVSRLTLWVNGEEREAAFSTRGKVRDAYQRVAVVQRRDPVLVTTCGPDRILMQCFPVPPEGGTMKVRVGITSPLSPDGYSHGLFALPRFVEKNFSIPDGVKHSLFIESPKAISYGEDSSVSPPAMRGKSIISKTLSDADLRKSAAVIRCSRDADVRQMWTPDRLQPDRYAVVQNIIESDVEPPHDLVIVIDGSQWLGGMGRKIAEALEELPGGGNFSVVLAGEPVRELSPMTPVSSEAIREVSQEVIKARFTGGIDNRAALLQAWDVLLAQGGGTILWIHGPQPLTSDARTEQILQRWERLPGSVQLYSLSAVDGRNSVLTDLERTGIVHSVQRNGDLSSDLTALFRAWKGAERQFITVRERVPIGAAGKGARSSGHLGRLWALDEVARICAKADSRLLSKAADLAAEYQLVTPVSGAVVLETQEQYEQSDLQAVDPSTVPSVVPEPSTLLALTTGLAFAGTSLYRSRRRRQGT